MRALPQRWLPAHARLTSLTLPPSPLRIQWRFALLGLLSGAATWTQIHGWHITTFVLSLLVASLVSTIYYVVRTNHRSGLADELFVHLPFSLYHAWALVLVVLSAFDAFGRSVHHPAGVWTKVFVFLALFFLESSAIGCERLPLSPRCLSAWSAATNALPRFAPPADAWSSREGDVGGAAVITWALWAIFSHQRSSAFIHWSALAFAVLASLNVVKAFITTWRASGGSPLAILHDEERAPLTGSS